MAFHNISKFVTSNNHTHIILINVPHTYDSTNANTTNYVIGKFNKKLDKLIKISPHASFLKTEQNRKLFTKHGLHFNRKGKHCLLHQLALKMYSLFVQKTTSPMSHSRIKMEASEGNSLHRTTTHSRKLPVTSPTDFLW